MFPLSTLLLAEWKVEGGVEVGLCGRVNEGLDSMMYSGVAVSLKSNDLSNANNSDNKTRSMFY